MKKNYSFYLTLLCIPVFAMLFLSYSSGQTIYYVSGSPSDNIDALNNQGAGIIGDCSTCHTGNPVIVDSPIISLNVPTEYEINTTYSISITSSSSAARQGFQMSVEDTNNMKVGDFTDDRTTTQEFVSPIANRGEAITHTYSGAFNNSWTFDWTSPATDVGPVTFYVALNESNSDNNSTGDQIHLKQSQVNLLSVDTKWLHEIKMFPNPAQNELTINIPNNLETTSLEVFDFLGKLVLTQNVSTKSTVDVSNWQSGVYIMQFTNKNTRVSKRFIKK